MVAASMYLDNLLGHPLKLPQALQIWQVDADYLNQVL